MFIPQKRIFAGKGDLRAEPLCPFLTDDIGYSSYRRTTDTGHQFSSYGGYIQAEPTYRTRKSKA